MKKLIVSTTKYVVAENDTLERIAARCDCTPSQLIKLNKLPSRILFSGQTIFVPDGSTTVEEDASSTASETASEPLKINVTDQVPEAPPTESPNFEDLAAELDAECVQKFLKLNTNQVTKNDGLVPGVLIITPNCVMFDPDTRHPSVVDGGPDKYGVVAPIDAVVLVGLYEGSPNAIASTSSKDHISETIIDAEQPDGENIDEMQVSPLSKEHRNRTISEEYFATVETDDIESLPEVVDETSGLKRRASTSDFNITTLQLKLLANVSENAHQPRRSSFSFPFHFRDAKQTITSSSPSRRLSGLLKRREKVSSDSREHSSSFSGKRKLSAGKNDSSDAEKSGHLDFNDSWFPSGDQLDESLAKQRENYDALTILKKKTEDLRKNLTLLVTSNKNQNQRKHSSANDDHRFQLPTVHHVSFATSYYLRICLDERLRKKEITKNAGLYDFGDKSRNEFLFVIPSEKVDVLYALFLQWASEKNQIDLNSVAGRRESLIEVNENNDLGFVFIDDPNQNPRFELDFVTFASNFDDINFKFNWEIVSLYEMKRRLSLLEITEASFLTLPDGTDQSKILTESMIRRIVSFLPARAQGYPWLLMYSSDVHGFSLGTMYRNMLKWKDELSPTLLIIKDTNHCVFGAVVNCVFKISEHFYGSGESMLFSVFPEFRVYRWTGVNNFIVKGGLDSLAIGAGHGTFGIYLDADFYHGRTQHCDTFDNDPLTMTEDFTIACVEAFGFSMTF